MIANAILAVMAAAGFSSPLWLEGVAMHSGLILAGAASGALLTRIWCHSRNRRMIKDATSNAERDRKHAVATADRHVAAWRAIVDHAVEGIVTIDSQGRVETVNDAAEAMFGYSREELIGKNAKVLMPEPFHSKHDEYLARYLRVGVRRIIGIGREVAGRRKDKSQFPIDLSLGEGTIEGRQFFTAVIRDITERKALQTKLGHTERLAAVGELAAGVAHEINNPINTMINCAQLIEDGDEPIENSRIIIEEGGRIADIVRALLQFARDDHDHAQPTSLAEVVEQTMSLIGESWRRHCITLTIDVDDDLPMILARPQKVQQVLLNLMTNAKDALVLHNAESRYVSLAAQRAGEGVEFSVSDNGPGVAASVRNRIFEPFITTKRARGGTGLGLPICRSIIEGYGGTIRIAADDNGSVVTIWLPIAPTDPSETSSTDLP
jgi:two-component system sensor kinase FixL